MTYLTLLINVAVWLGESSKYGYWSPSRKDVHSIGQVGRSTSLWIICSVHDKRSNSILRTIFQERKGFIRRDASSVWGMSSSIYTYVEWKTAGYFQWIQYPLRNIRIPHWIKSKNQDSCTQVKPGRANVLYTNVSHDKWAMRVILQG